MNKEQTLSFLREHKLVAITRGVAPCDIVATAQALFDGGIRSLEIPFFQEAETCIRDTAECIGLVRAALGEKMCIGAGTVMTAEQADAAAEAGADFALAPNTDPEIIRRIAALGMVAVPGAMTPSEIAAAQKAGAGLVKLFPADSMGLSYVKAVRAPMGHIPLLAVGGVTVENVRAFLDAGFVGVGIGSSLVSPVLIKAGKFDEITALAREFLAAAKA